MQRLRQTPAGGGHTQCCQVGTEAWLAALMRVFARKVRREVVDWMRQLMKLAKEKSGEGMFPIVEEMLKKTKLICSIPDTVLVQESLHFLEQNKINKRPEKDEFSESVSEFMQRNKLKIEIETKPSCGSLQTPCTEFICKELRTPDTDQVGGGGGEVWRGYSVYTSGYHSVDRLSDIDEFEESFKMGPSNQPGTPIRSSGPASLLDSTDDLSLDTGEPLGEEYSLDMGEEEVENVDGVVEEDEDSTPHIMSETSKTQSPVSTGKISLEQQLEEPLSSSQEEDEVIEHFNQGERGKSLAEELALQIELESDKGRLQGEGGGGEGNLLQQEEINAKQFWDNKICQQTLQHPVKADLSGEDTSPARSLQTKTDFGIVSGNIS